MDLDFIVIFLLVYALVVTAVTAVLTLHKDTKIEKLRKALQNTRDTLALTRAELEQAKKNDTPRDPVTGQFVKMRP
jgi:cell division protein FtsL